jgi:inhibitor of cysteine peptidase
MRYVTILLAFLTIGCASRQTPPRWFDDPSQPIVVNAGETFEIRLPSNRSTGYLWRIEEGGLDSGALRLTRTDYVQQAGAPGAAGNQVWEFQAHTRGKTQLVFAYLKPWENGPPAKRQRFTINVW